MGKSVNFRHRLLDGVRVLRVINLKRNRWIAVKSTDVQNSKVKPLFWGERSSISSFGSCKAANEDLNLQFLLVFWV